VSRVRARRRELPANRRRLIQVARRQLGLEDEVYRALLERMATVSSSRDLCPAGFELVMAEFARLGFKSTSPLKPLPERAGMATPMQTSRIRGLWQEVTTDAAERRLRVWLERHFGVSDLHFINRELAPRVITALQGWRERLAERVGRPSQAD
jgi:hypothetical protein